jgi:hypothetical protein
MSLAVERGSNLNGYESGINPVSPLLPKKEIVL